MCVVAAKYDQNTTESGNSTRTPGVEPDTRQCLGHPVINHFHTTIWGTVRKSALADLAEAGRNARCFGYAKFHHPSDLYSEEWRPALIDRSETVGTSKRKYKVSYATRSTMVLSEHLRGSTVWGSFFHEGPHYLWLFAIIIGRKFPATRRSEPHQIFGRRLVGPLVTMVWPWAQNIPPTARMRGHKKQSHKVFVPIYEDVVRLS